VRLIRAVEVERDGLVDPPGAHPDPLGIERRGEVLALPKSLGEPAEAKWLRRAGQEIGWQR